MNNIDIMKKIYILIFSIVCGLIAGITVYYTLGLIFDKFMYWLEDKLIERGNLNG